MKAPQTTEGWIRVIAGTFVLASLALGVWVHRGWLLLAAFVGLNLIQSAFTGFCPPEMLLRRWGVGCSAEWKSGAGGGGGQA